VAKPPQDRTAGASNTYFITTSTDGGRALLQSERVANLFLTTLFAYRDDKKFQVHEFVVMPNHIHVLITPGEGITIERAMQFIKGGFSHKVKKELGIASEIWQRGYVDHRVRDASDYAQHKEYIRANPVRAHLANTPEEYRYCSAFPGFTLDAVPQRLKPRE
jgi:putative transposase